MERVLDVIVSRLIHCGANFDPDERSRSHHAKQRSIVEYRRLRFRHNFAAAKSREPTQLRAVTAGP